MDARIVRTPTSASSKGRVIIVNMLLRASKSWLLRYVPIAVIAFTLGGATVVQAVAPGGIAGVVKLADGANDSRLAKVDASGNVAVSVMNAPTVQVKRQPFQQGVFIDLSSGEACELIVVPAGMRLTIQAFSAVTEAAIGEPEVYLRTTARLGDGSTSDVRSLKLELRQDLSGVSTWSGDAQTLLFTGATSDPRGSTFSYAACVRTLGGNFARLSALVSGYLETTP